MKAAKALTPEELKTLNDRFEKYSELCDLYNSNEEFKRFVDKSCVSYGLHKDIALLHKTIQDVGDYYMHKDDDTAPDICPNPIEVEDKAC